MMTVEILDSCAKLFQELNSLESPPVPVQEAASGADRLPLIAAVFQSDIPARTTRTDTTDQAIGDLIRHGEVADVVINQERMRYVQDANDDRPVVYLKEGQLQATVRDAEKCLSKTGHHFHRGGAIVTVYTDPATGASRIQDTDPLAVVHALAGVSSWRRSDTRTGSWREIDPDERICRLISKSRQFEYLPVLKGLARQPFLRADGSLCKVAHYDSASGMYGVFESANFNVPDHPTRAQAEAAVGLLGDLLGEFPFASPNDRSAALSGMLTAVTRSSLAMAPLFHVRAHQIASGKSCLCELISALATSQYSAPVDFPDKNEECKKLLIAQLARSPAVIQFDNLTTDLLAHKSLCTTLTSERIEGRILGQSKMVEVSTRALFLSSGNNVGPVADMVRRCVTINLDPQCEVPAARKFKQPDLIGAVHKERARYVSAALTIVRAWIEAGRPEAPCQPLANFSEWSDICRQPLLWLGMPDPAESVYEVMAEDSGRQTLGTVLSIWHEQFGGDVFMVRQVIRRAAGDTPDSEDMNDALLDATGDRGAINPRKLGQWMKRHAGQIVGGLRLVKAPKTRNAENWRVESVASVREASVVEPSVEIC